MIKKSNNNLILIVIIIIIIGLLYLCSDIKNNNNCNLCKQQFKNTKKKVNFKNKNNVKYFNYTDSPSEIRNMKEEKENMIIKKI